MKDEAIRPRIPDIVTGARLLLENRLSFSEACRLHIEKLEATGYDVAQFGYFAGSAKL